MRKKYFAANWKMNKNPDESKEYFSEFLKGIKSEIESDFIFFPPTINLMVTANELKSTQISWGAQNIYYKSSGAFTGELSPQVLSKVGADFCLVGHSERRTLFYETNEDVYLKFKAIQSCGMTPLLCIGESLTEKDSGTTIDVLKNQLNLILESLNNKMDWVLAYEPVWAIGTGKVASPEEAEEVHRAIRSYVLEVCGSSVADSLSILYGGSVKSKNCKELFRKPNIDGFLVGGASLIPQDFIEIHEKSFT